MAISLSDWHAAAAGRFARHDHEAWGTKMKTFGLAMMLTVLVSGAAVAQQPGDAAAGEKVFAKCKACHSIGEGATNRIGPVLTDVVGRQPGTYEGYSYSDAMKAFGGENPAWTPELLHAFLTAPKTEVPGTKMAFPGLKEQADRDNVIAYLMTFSPDYAPAADGAAAPAADGAAAPAPAAPAQ
jgi:cytochrome c